MIRNLVDNAELNSHPSIHVPVEWQDDHAMLRVNEHGPGRPRRGVPGIRAHQLIVNPRPHQEVTKTQRAYAWSPHVRETSTRHVCRKGECVSNPFDDEDGEFLVLINHEEQYSLWPAFKDVPAGCTAVGPRGARKDFLAYI
jgi:MbtH protein